MSFHMKHFVPLDLLAPQRAVLGGGFVLEKLTIDCLQEDYDAFMSSMEAIHAQRGPYWPTPEFTIEENRKDLYWHEKEFDENLSFAYVIRDDHGQ